MSPRSRPREHTVSASRRWASSEALVSLRLCLQGRAAAAAGRGDGHYMGLDALQLFGADGRELTAAGSGGRTPPIVHAHPADVNVLADVSGDPRTVDKLFVPPPGPPPGGAGGAADLWAAPSSFRKGAADVWLAPWSPHQVNELWLSFNEPVALSLLRVLNYSKSPARGVDDFELLLDGLLVYRGRLRKSTGGEAEADWQSILFCQEEAVLRRESDAGRVFFSGAPEHAESGVLLINDGQVMNEQQGGMAAPLPPSRSSSRPKTAVTGT